MAVTAVEFNLLCANVAVHKVELELDKPRPVQMAAIIRAAFFSTVVSAQATMLWHQSLDVAVSGV